MGLNRVHVYRNAPFRPAPECTGANGVNRCRTGPEPVQKFGKAENRCRTGVYTCILCQVLWVYFRQSIQIKTTILTIIEVVPSTIEVVLSMVTVFLSMVGRETATTLTADNIKSVAANSIELAKIPMLFSPITIAHEEW